MAEKVTVFTLLEVGYEVFGKVGLNDGAAEGAVGRAVVGDALGSAVGSALGTKDCWQV